MTWNDLIKCPKWLKMAVFSLNPVFLFWSDHQLKSHPLTPDGKLEAAGRCLTPMATTDKNVYPSGDPCDSHSDLEKAGTILFGLACDAQPNDYQKWVMSEGMIQLERRLVKILILSFFIHFCCWFFNHWSAFCRIRLSTRLLHSPRWAIFRVDRKESLWRHGFDKVHAESAGSETQWWSSASSSFFRRRLGHR